MTPFGVCRVSSAIHRIRNIENMEIFPLDGMHRLRPICLCEIV